MKVEKEKGNIERNKSGITLIALIITIIILLILAGITISLTIGQNGILKRAQESGINYTNAAEYENEELAELLNTTDNIITGLNSQPEAKYTIVDGIPVPKGFKHIEGTKKETGFVIQDISENKTNGNEFVWIPCDETIQYNRYAFARDGWQFSQIKNETTGQIQYNDSNITQSFTENVVSLEIDSVKRYGGFYIGRYEVGIEEGALNIEDMLGQYTAPNAQWTGWKNGKAVVKRGKQVWNYVTREKAEDIASGMYDGNNIVTSRLCSSYAWDTTVKFIELQNVNYGTQGNTTQDNYIGGLKNTGEGGTGVSNIYDMGGNVAELTTEIYLNDNSYTFRGGSFGNTGVGYPAGFRFNLAKNAASSSVGFRIALYILP